ncbi:hypothetical protein [Buchnera aphidicola]|nr:hypothetical protein [Buchnera aphidicola]
MILEIVIPILSHRCFYYMCNSYTIVPKIGVRVQVPFRNRLLIGIVLRYHNKFKISHLIKYKLKSIDTVIDTHSLFGTSLWNLLIWYSNYSHIYLGKIVLNILPLLLRKGIIYTKKYLCWSITDSGKKKLQLPSKLGKKQIFTLSLLKKKNIYNLEIKKYKISNAVLSSLSIKGFCILQKTHYVQKIVYVFQRKHYPNLNILFLKEIEKILKKNKYTCPFYFSDINFLQKVEVYLFLLYLILNKGQTSLLIVPCTNTTLVYYIKNFFYDNYDVDVLIYDTKLNETKKIKIWDFSKTSIPKIIISTKMGIFLPLTKLGLIIVDEECDLNHIYYNKFIFNAKLVAIERAKKENIPIFLTSSSLSITSYKEIVEKRYHEIRVSVFQEKITKYHVYKNTLIYLKKERNIGIYSVQLIKIISRHLLKNTVILLILEDNNIFYNLLQCDNCKKMLQCFRCNNYYKFNKSCNNLFCPYCFCQENIPNFCIYCGFFSFSVRLFDIELAKKYLSDIFPNVKILSFSKNITSEEIKKNVDKNYCLDFCSSTIILSTPDFANRFLIKNVSLVAFLSLEKYLYSNNFRSIEYCGKLYYSVLFVLMNSKLKIRTVIQTPEENFLLTTLFKKNYSYFLNELCKNRKNLLLPPFRYHTVIWFECIQEQVIILFTKYFKKILCKKLLLFAPDLIIIGPELIKKRKYTNCYYSKILFSYFSITFLQNILVFFSKKISVHSQFKDINFLFDVDSEKN